MDSDSDEESAVDTEYRFERKLDNRLFPQFPLYCEGLEKPMLRGISHLLCCLLLPFGMWHLIVEAKGSFGGELAAFFNVGSNMWCYGFSALFHVGTWSVKTEIMLQKLDHCGIAILSCGPVSLLLFSPRVGNMLIWLSCSACIWACWNIMNLRLSIIRLVIVPSCFIPFLPFCYQRMNAIEYRGTICTMLLQIIGLIIFNSKKPDPWPRIFGYHEVFHIFVISAGICVYLANWSIIRRTSNPYARDIDVVEILKSLFFPHTEDYVHS